MQKSRCQDLSCRITLLSFQRDYTRVGPSDKTSVLCYYVSYGTQGWVITNSDRVTSTEDLPQLAVLPRIRLRLIKISLNCPQCSKSLGHTWYAECSKGK
jgi:hypothetical protein